MEIDALNTESLSGAILGSGTLANNSTMTAAAFSLTGDISAFTGTFTFNATTSGNNFAIGGSTAGSASGWPPERRLFSPGVTSGSRALKLGSSTQTTFQVEHWSGTGGMISGGDTFGDTIQVGALNTSTTFAGTILNPLGGGSTAFTKVGTGTLTLSGANTYTGTTTINGGVLAAGVVSVGGTSGAFGNNSAVTLANTAGVSLNITGFNTQIGSITGGGTTGGSITLGSATLTVGGNNTSPAAYSGAITGTGGNSLVKIGTGTLTLNGSNSSISGINVNAGTLEFSGGTGSNIPGLTTVQGSGSVFKISGGSLNSQAYTADNGGTILITGGTWTPQCTSNPAIGSSATPGATATFTQTGGTVTLGNAAPVMYTSNNAGQLGNLNFSGGVFNAQGIQLGMRDNSTATISNSALVSLSGFFRFGHTTNIGSPTSRILNLGDGAEHSSWRHHSINDGGTSGILATATVTFTSGAGNATFNFKGGTLRATGPSTTFMQGLTTATVQDAGGIIDNNNNAITIAQALLHGGVAATDGGLSL